MKFIKAEGLKRLQAGVTLDLWSLATARTPANGVVVYKAEGLKRLQAGVEPLLTLSLYMNPDGVKRSQAGVALDLWSLATARTPATMHNT